MDAAYSYSDVMQLPSVPLKLPLQITVQALKAASVGNTERLRIIPVCLRLAVPSLCDCHRGGILSKTRGDRARHASFSEYLPGP